MYSSVVLFGKRIFSHFARVLFVSLSWITVIQPQKSSQYLRTGLYFYSRVSWIFFTLAPPIQIYNLHQQYKIGTGNSISPSFLHAIQTIPQMSIAQQSKPQNPSSSAQGTHSHNSHNMHNLQNMTTDQLRSLLKQLQIQHDITQAKNEQLATHISDMRAVIKTVEKEKDEQINYTIAKKKKLQDEIERCEAALKVANSKSNTMFADMVAFKELNTH